jgi:hypothetical protein
MKTFIAQCDCEFPKTYELTVDEEQTNAFYTPAISCPYCTKVFAYMKAEDNKWVVNEWVKNESN